MNSTQTATKGTTKALQPQELRDVVQVPRAALKEALYSRPFSELRAMAERGEHGMKNLSVPAVTRNTLGNGSCAYQLRRIDEDGKEYVQNVQVDKDVASLRCGVDIRSGNKDRAFLYAQNW